MAGVVTVLAQKKLKFEVRFGLSRRRQLRKVTKDVTSATARKALCSIVRDGRVQMKKLAYAALVTVTILAASNDGLARYGRDAADAAQPSERDAVQAAVLDYVEALYSAQPERIQRSMHPGLTKRGYFKKNGETTFSNEPMTYEQLIALAGRWNKDGKRPVATYPKEIVVFDVLNQTASAKLTAMWGVDYFHLAKYDGQWKIVNILWQEPPAK